MHFSVLFGIFESKKSNSITSKEAFKSFVTAVNQLRENVVKYFNNREQSEAITEYITSQQAKRPRRAATHASVSHLELQSCVTEACDTITEEVKENFGSLDIQSFAKASEHLKNMSCKLKLIIVSSTMTNHMYTFQNC